VDFTDLKPDLFLANDRLSESVPGSLSRIVRHLPKLGFRRVGGTVQNAMGECHIIQGTIPGVRSKRPRSNDSVMSVRGEECSLRESGSQDGVPKM
jgi:hypothetical protein